MNKLVIIFLLVVTIAGGFLPNMDTCELAKIPQLIGHYKEHTEERKQSLSFLDFLVLHYGLGEESEKHQGQENHESLPLHHQHSFHIVAIHFSEPLNFTIGNYDSNAVYNSAYLYTEYSEYSFSLLLPPKV